MTEDFAALQAQMQVYFDGLYHSDTERLGQVFHPDAHYVCATDDDLTRLTMKSYFDIVDARPSPASRSEARADEIVSIGFAGPRTAIVRAHCAVGARYFTDLLTFIKTGGTWRIISKVFHYDHVSPATGPTS